MEMDWKIYGLDRTVMMGTTVRYFYCTALQRIVLCPFSVLNGQYYK